MRRLKLNHARGQVPGPGTLVSGLVLLLISGALIAVYSQLAEDNAALQKQLEARQVAISPVVNKQTTLSLASNQAITTEIAEAQAQIQTPWIALLNTLEKVQQPQLYWMQLAPDAKRKHIRMTVLAPHRQQGWALVARLKRQSALADVKLNASESTDVNGLMMTTLQLEAGWLY
ncbi:MAG: hypothetical protein ACTS9Y_09145 [Methylophilus sp.]|uniref:hypothetical protein n=1 Tax=Methylophilus sp. TaxID=29541 RepID=UPI003FA140DA